MGAIDGDPGVRIGAHQFTDYASPWFMPPDDGLPLLRRPVGRLAGFVHESSFLEWNSIAKSGRYRRP